MPGKETRYRPVFSIQLHHPKIRSEKDILFQISPSEDCRVLLKNLRWIFKSFSNGCWVIVPLTNGEPLITIDSMTLFTFHITATEAGVLSKTIPFSAKGLSQTDTEDKRWVLAGKPMLHFNNLDANGALDAKPANGNTQKQLLSKGAKIAKEDLGITAVQKTRREPEKPAQPFIQLAAVNRDFTNFELRQILPTSGAVKLSEANLDTNSPDILFDLSSNPLGAHELLCSNGADAYTYPVYVEKMEGPRSRLAIVEIFKTADTLDFNSASPVQYHATFETD